MTDGTHNGPVVAPATPSDVVGRMRRFLADPIEQERDPEIAFLRAAVHAVGLRISESVGGESFWLSREDDEETPFLWALWTGERWEVRVGD